MKHMSFSVIITFFFVSAVLSDDMPTKDTIDRATIDRAYAKLRERPQASATQPTTLAILPKAVKPSELDGAAELKKLSDAAGAELATARANAIRHYRESDSAAPAIADVDAARRNRFAADELNDRADRAKAAQILLDAKNRLAQAELQFAAADPAVIAATLKAEITDRSYKRYQSEAAKQIAFARSEAEKAIALERDHIRRNVVPGMSIYNITTVLGEPERVSTIDGDRKSYQWVVYSYGKRKSITRIVTADVKYGEITSVIDTHYKVDHDD